MQGKLGFMNYGAYIYTYYCNFRDTYRHFIFLTKYIGLGRVRKGIDGKESLQMEFMQRGLYGRYVSMLASK